MKKLIYILAAIILIGCEKETEEVKPEVFNIVGTWTNGGDTIRLASGGQLIHRDGGYWEWTLGEPYNTLKLTIGMYPPQRISNYKFKILEPRKMQHQYGSIYRKL